MNLRDEPVGGTRPFLDFREAIAALEVAHRYDASAVYDPGTVVVVGSGTFYRLDTEEPSQGVSPPADPWTQLPRFVAGGSLTAVADEFDLAETPGAVIRDLTDAEVRVWIGPGYADDAIYTRIA